MTKRKRLKPFKSVLDARMGPDKPEPKDPLAAVKHKHPPPWRAVCTVLRPPPFDTPIIFVADDNGKEVMPWGGFDQMSKLTKREKLALARAIARMGNEK
jgi:hypothetical protein